MLTTYDVEQPIVELEVPKETSGSLIKVCGVLRDNAACGLYRIKQPLTLLNEHEDFDVAIGGMDFVEFGEKNDLFELLRECDVSIIPRAATEATLDLISALKGLDRNKKIIVDYDDNIFDVNPMSPHYRDFGLEEVTAEVDGEKIKVWENGKGLFDIERNKLKVESVEKILRLTDAITVTTEELAEVYRKYNDCVYVLPNTVDLSIWNPVRIVKDGTTRLTWHGGSSHYHDLYEVKPVLENITKNHSGVKLEICGHEFKGIFKNMKDSQYQFHEWVPTEVHPYKQALLNSDIALLPLKDDLFNRGKSPIKWVEYSSLKIPCVAKNIPPYSEVIEHGETGYLYNDVFECSNYLEKLIENPSLRESIGNKAYNYVAEHYNAKDNVSLWAETIKKITRK